MARYRSFGNLDDPYVEDGDLEFRGLDMYKSPTLLSPGMLQRAENIRINEGVITARKGMTKLFSLSNGLSLKLFSDPDGEENYPGQEAERLLVIATNGIFNKESVTVGVYNDENYETTDRIETVQAFDKLIIFADGKRPREWTGRVSDRVTKLSTVPGDSAVDFVCPNAAFGNYLSNRLVVPKTDESSTTVAFSDILQLNQFSNLNTYSCNKGTSDVTLAIAPYAENQALILNNKSIHIINGTHFLGNNSTNFEITRQYGIAGTKSWVQNGSYIYFISNEGDIQVLVPSSDPAKGLGISISKVTLDQEPLSKPVTPIIKRINVNAVATSVVHYSKNIVYFAIPIDGAERPNAILVYDSLLSQFISLDNFTNSNLEIIDMASQRDELFILTNEGLYKYEDNDLQSDDGFLFQTIFQTRNFLMGSRGVKTFKSGSIAHEVSDGTRIRLEAKTVDPDQSTEIKDQTFNENTDLISRYSLRKRGYSASIKVTSENKPARYKSVHLEASYSSNTIGDFE